MVAFTFCLCVVMGQQGPGTVDVADFVRLVEAKTAPLKDLGLLYEGTFRWVGSKSTLGRDPLGAGNDFQGAYLYRRNDAAFMDVYRRMQANPAQVERRRISLLKGSLERKILTSRDKGEARRDPKRFETEEVGGMGSLGGMASPNILFKAWELLEMAKDHGEDFRVMGTASLDGRSCFRFRVGYMGVREKDGSYEDYWIDLDRSANVVRIDTYEKGKLSIRVDQVALKEVKLPDGVPYWLPVRVRMLGYQWEGTFHGSPVMETIVEVVDGTILVNQGLPDGIFTVKRETGLPGPGELSALRQKASDLRLARAYEQAPEDKPLRLDPAGARERLEGQLEEAEAQSKMLEASAPSRESWSWVGLTQVVAVVAAIATVACVWTLRKRAG